MKTRRYYSNDLRSAVLAVRDELGSNAVILSQKKSKFGIEVIATTSAEQHPAASVLFPRQVNAKSDLDDSELHNGVFNITAINTVNKLVRAGRDAFSDCVFFFKTGTGSQNKYKHCASKLNGNDSCTSQQELNQNSLIKNCGNHRPGSGQRNSSSEGVMERVSMNKAVVQDKPVEDVQHASAPLAATPHCLNKLTNLVEQQILEHAWGELARKNPLRARLIRQLIKMDIHPLIIQRITDTCIGKNLEEKSLLPHALALLANQLPIYQEDITAGGGTVALFGATGAGKTTTVAKLAARYALRHGREKVAVVTTDNQRIAAHEQLRVYGEILGIAFKAASDAGELMDALNAFSDKDFVLIDTAGMSYRDVQSNQVWRLFSGVLSQVRSFLVMPASAHHSVLEHTANAFRSIKLDGSIITKLDEAANLGGPLSVAILNNLPVAYYSDGQKIPDDFHLARAHNLVSRAISVADQFVETPSVKAANQDKAGIEANVSI